MPAPDVSFVAEIASERAALIELVECMQEGRLTAGPLIGNATANIIGHLQKRVAELDVLIDSIERGPSGSSVRS